MGDKAGLIGITSEAMSERHLNHRVLVREAESVNGDQITKLNTEPSKAYLQALGTYRPRIIQDTA